MSDAELADLVCRDRIDVLVDLGGHMGGNRLTMFARRPAPVQVTHFNYPATTGMTAMDWRITDSLAEPEGAHLCRTGVPPVGEGEDHRQDACATSEEHRRDACATSEGHRRDACATGAPAAAGSADCWSVERLYRLPHCGWCYHPGWDVPGVGPLPALAGGGVTFGSLNKLLKHSAEAVALWCRVLAAVPGSRFMMFGLGSEKEDGLLAEAFARHGVGRERLAFVPRLPRGKYLNLYNRMDVSLDPFPYNGGVTSCDGLYMGVPLVSLVGDSYRARQGLMLLSNLGLAELAAATGDDYVAAAAALARDLPRLAGLRAGLRERMRRSPLMDGPGFARDLGAAYREMWRQWCGNAGGR